MSYITQSHDNEYGPIILVEICDTVSGKRKTGKLLIDTGASHSCVKKGFLSDFMLNPIGATEIFTPSTRQGGESCFCFNYFVGLEFLDHKNIIEAEITEVPLFGQEEIDGLLGRDILQQGLFIFDGKNNIFSLAF